MHPTHDHRGDLSTTEPWLSLARTELAGGCCGLLWLFRSDADYIHKDLNIPGYWAKNEPCYSCFCNKTVGPNHLLSFGPTSSWPTTIFLDMADFFLHCANHGKPIHRLFRPRGHPGCLGLHILIFMRDSLHVMDLGMSQGLIDQSFGYCASVRTCSMATRLTFVGSFSATLTRCTRRIARRPVLGTWSW